MKYPFCENDIRRHRAAMPWPHIDITYLSTERKDSRRSVRNIDMGLFSDPEARGFGPAGLYAVMLRPSERCFKTNLLTAPGPYSAHPFFLFDDTNEAGLAHLDAIGFRPCVTYETSPGNYQGWIRAAWLEAFPPTTEAEWREFFPSNPDQARRQQAYPEWNIAFSRYAQRLDQDGRRRVERYIVSELKKVNGGGDYGAAIGKRFGRLAGTWNPEKKTTERRKGRPAFLTRLIQDSGDILDLETSYRLLAAAEAHAVTDVPAPERKQKERDIVTVAVSGGIHEYDDPRVVDALEYLAGLPHKNDDASAEDFFLATRLAVAGFSKEDIQQAIIEAGPNDPDRHEEGWHSMLIDDAFARSADRIAAIRAILDHPYERPEIREALAALPVKAGASLVDRDWFRASKLSEASFSPADIKAVIADPLDLVVHPDPANYLHRTVNRACAKFPPKPVVSRESSSSRRPRARPSADRT